MEITFCIKDLASEQVTYETLLKTSEGRENESFYFRIAKFSTRKLGKRCRSLSVENLCSPIIMKELLITLFTHLEWCGHDPSVICFCANKHRSTMVLDFVNKYSKQLLLQTILQRETATSH
jgi:hypothetical protein